MSAQQPPDRQEAAPYAKQSTPEAPATAIAQIATQEDSPRETSDSTAASSALRRAEASRRRNTLLRALFSYAVLATAFGVGTSAYASTITTGGEPWMTGDWLINYAGGFVRRALFGELFLGIAPPGASGLWTLLGVQLAFYAVLLAYALQVLHQTRYALSSIALVCGPAALPFVGWDPDGGFRKEIIAFAALALLAWARRSHRRPWMVVVLVLIALPLYVLAVFSWEASALLLPAIAYLLLARGAPHRGLDTFRWSAATVFAVVAVVGAGLSTLAHGDVAASHAICEHLRAQGYDGPQICGADATAGGAIEAIGWSPDRTRQDLALSFPLYGAYLPYIALALVPVAASRWFRVNWRWALIIAAGVLPLFLVVTDYGRWTHILVIALMLCMTAADPNRAASRIWTPVATVLYVSMWALPHHLAPEGAWPWLGLARTVVDQAIEVLGAAMGRM